MKSAGEVTKVNSVPEEWQPLLDLAVREVFEIMMGCKLETQSPVRAATPEITAMVGLAGQLRGLLTVRCSLRSAALMASMMLGVTVDETNEQMFDAMGEMANMVAGNFKNKLTGMAGGCMLSVPTVITGSNYSCRSMADSGPIEVSLLFDGTSVTIALDIHT